ncbi:Galactose/lactose metabolism regulatory protein GAL80 [Daldinia childiae]|uniref:Galactose/lactose metabolism regulatory protein GAL80 n=1 Tax=Daldinia childiae TaxID=326645 RepID=UPI001446835D|nr:Galactose/lactose metabolism regulatory protein GAL80 [Daldinia childiae]KAF3056467.1 Galactose/lactose metabolism regulatory protein GAL80 [Daldinia childiae]
MAPIRVALIGLSSSAKTSWAAQGHLPYLLSPRGKCHYEIVALLNSSVESAEAARKHFLLPSDVRTYGDPNDLALDPDVDFVVCCTRVDTHSLTAEPSLRAGKAVYIEWPLVENCEEAVALTANKRLDNSIIGLQGRVSPIVLKLKEILKSGRIGRVLSSDIRAYGNLLPRDSLPEGLSYFANRNIGGNPITIAYGHTIDYVHEVLGEFSSFKSRMQIQRPVVAVLGKDGTQIKKIESDVPDFLVVHGKLAKGKADIAEDATLSITYRSGQQFKGTPGFLWTINGEVGEIMVTANGAYVHSDSYREPIKIKIHDHASDEVIDVEWDWEDWQKELPYRSRIVAELYERYARWWYNGRPTGDLSEMDWPRLHDAVVRMKEIDKVFKQYDA